MLRGLWEVFLAKIRREESADDGHRFLPSPLDLSVRTSHGGSDDEIERELSKIEEQARAVAEERRDRE